MKCFFSLFMVILISFGLNAEVYQIDQGQNQVELVSSNTKSIRISYKISNFNYEPVKIGKDTFYEPELTKEANKYEKGMPAVPYINRNIIIPDQTKMAVNIIESRWVEIKMLVAPSKGIITRNNDPQKILFTFAPFYQTKENYPSAIAELSKPFILRDFRGITVTANPFVYYPETKTLRVYTHLILEIVTVGKDPENVSVTSRNNYNKYFENIYQNQFLNFQNDRYTQVNDKGRMLIIAPNLYLSSMQALVDWKNQKGIKTTLVDYSSVASSNTTLKTYLQNQYNLNDGLVFVLLCGDAAQIPTFTSGGGGSDPTYSLLAGNDNYPEIFVGRFSAENTTQLLTQVNRTIQYERDLDESATWLQSATGIASNEGGPTQGDNGESDAIHMNNIRDDLLGYGYNTVDQIYQGLGGSTAGISSAINSGRGFVNYVGHGSTTGWGSVTFSNTNVNALTNTNKLPFIMDVACVNGNFTSTTCFAEAWMRASSGANPTGAVGIYASSINQSWNEPMRAQDEFTDLLISNQKNTLGGLYFNSSLKMMEVYGTSGASMFLTWHIFGDPSLQIRTKVPQIINAVYPASIPTGTTTYEVSTGIQDALICLSHHNQIIASGYTDSTGNTTMNLTNLPAAPDTMKLTITAYNSVSQTDSIYLTQSTNTNVDPPLNVIIQPQIDGIHINWSPVSNATSFHIYRSSSINGTYTEISRVTTNSFLDQTAPGNSNYYYITAESLADTK